MNIAIIGAGKVGGALGTSWAKAGHTIVFGVRDPVAGKTTPPLAEIGGAGSSSRVVPERRARRGCHRAGHPAGTPCPT